MTVWAFRDPRPASVVLGEAKAAMEKDGWTAFDFMGEHATTLGMRRDGDDFYVQGSQCSRLAGEAVSAGPEEWSYLAILTDTMEVGEADRALTALLASSVPAETLVALGNMIPPQRQDRYEEALARARPQTILSSLELARIHAGKGQTELTERYLFKARLLEKACGERYYREDLEAVAERFGLKKIFERKPSLEHYQELGFQVLGEKPMESEEEVRPGEHIHLAGRGEIEGTEKEKGKEIRSLCCQVRRSDPGASPGGLELYSNDGTSSGSTSGWVGEDGVWSAVKAIGTGKATIQLRVFGLTDGSFRKRISVQLLSQ